MGQARMLESATFVLLPLQGDAPAPGEPAPTGWAKTAGEGVELARFAGLGHGYRR